MMLTTTRAIAFLLGVVSLICLLIGVGYIILFVYLLGIDTSNGSQFFWTCLPGTAEY